MIKNLDALSKVAGITNVRQLDSHSYGFTLHVNEVRRPQYTGDADMEQPEWETAKVAEDYSVDFVISSRIQPRPDGYRHDILVHPTRLTQGEAIQVLGPFTHLKIPIDLSNYTIPFLKRNREIAGVLDVTDVDGLAALVSLVTTEGAFKVEGKSYIRVKADSLYQNNTLSKALRSGDALMMGLTLMHLAKNIHEDIPLALYPRKQKGHTISLKQRLVALA